MTTRKLLRSGTTHAEDAIDESEPFDFGATFTREIKNLAAFGISANEIRNKIKRNATTFGRLEKHVPSENKEKLKKFCTSQAQSEELLQEEHKGTLPPESLDSPPILYWDYAIPLLTWASFALFFILPPAIPVLIFLAPALIGSRRSALWTSLMKRVAKRKGYRFSDSIRRLPHPAVNPCIMGFHPHGKYPMSLFPAFETRPIQFSETGFVMAQSSLGKFVPTVGFVTALCGRVIDATKKNICAALERKQHVGIIPGGAREMTLCAPGKKEIDLVKHTGFLRLAYAQAKSTSQRRGSPCVVPCFAFGMQDAYVNPLSSVDEKLYLRTGVNLPLWLPSRNGGGICIVVANALDPHSFSSLDAFVRAYYASLAQLFEANKGRFAGYKDRSINFVSVSRRSKKAAPRSRGVKAHITTTLASFLFAILFLAIFASTGKAVRFSTQDHFERSTANELALHIASTITWAASSANLTIFGFFKLHRIVGYAALLSSLLMSASAYMLTVTSWNAAVENGGVISLLHALIHAASNLQVATIVPVMLGFALAAVRAKERRVHAKYMGMAHTLVGVNLSPRVIAWLISWMLPLSGTSAFTLACAIMWWTQVTLVLSCKNAEVRGNMVAMNAVSLSSSILILLAHCSIRAKGQVLLYPCGAAAAGAAIFFFRGTKAKSIKFD